MPNEPKLGRLVAQSRYRPLSPAGPRKRRVVFTQDLRIVVRGFENRNYVAPAGDAAADRQAPGGARDPGLQSLLKERTEALLQRSPVLAAHLDANLVLREQFAQRTQLWSAAKVAEFAKSSAENRHALTSRWSAEKRVFGVRDKAMLFPAFQFDPGTSRPYSEVRSIVEALAPDYEGWSLGIWFITPNDWLDGAAPLDVWPAKRDRVAAAAREEHDMFHG